jgi:hypothetical protein
MPIEKIQGATVFTGQAINLYRYIALKHALRLEIAGGRRKGRSAYTVLREMGFQGKTRAAVLENLEKFIENEGPRLAQS